MMLVKLAFRNVSRSARDYAIYFVTLLLGVSVFYAFNSIGSQQVLTEMMDQQGDFLNLLNDMIGLFSLVVSFVLAFLILYANRFLIKRRKREFGTYLLLGMKPYQVSLIVLLETACVGVVAFAVGIAFGIVLSQGLSYVTALLFGTVLDEYRFVFSAPALVKSMISFGTIFLVVGLFNVVQVRCCKLITLFSAQHASEKNRLRSVPVSIIGFLASIGCLAFAYLKLKENGLVTIDEAFVIATVFMLIGTLLFFWSVSGFAIALITRTRGIYLRGLTLFTVRQITSKINTAFLSLWAISVLLFFGVTVFATGMSLGSLLTNDLDDNTLYDATITDRFGPLSYIDERAGSDGEPEAYQAEQAHLQELRDAHLSTVLDQWNNCDGSIAQFIADTCPEWDSLVAQSAQIDLWSDPDMSYQDLFNKVPSVRDRLSDDNLDLYDAIVGVSVVSESQMNDTLRLSGADPISLEPGQYATNNTIDLSKDLAQELHAQNIPLTFNNTTLQPSGINLSHALRTQAFPSEACIIVVEDSIIEGYHERGIDLPLSSNLNLVYKEDVENPDDKFKEIVDVVAQSNLGPDLFPDIGWPICLSVTKSQIIEGVKGMRLLSTYLAIYIGFVLLAASAALLAIQQLSQIEESTSRMKTLSHLGCDEKSLRRSLLSQVLIYFLTPLAVASCHSIYALSILISGFQTVWGIATGPTIAFTFAITLLVYGGYMLVTWIGGRSLMNSALQKGRH